MQVRLLRPVGEQALKPCSFLSLTLGKAGRVEMDGANLLADAVLQDPGRNTPRYGDNRQVHAVRNVQQAQVVLYAQGFDAFDFIRVNLDGIESPLEVAVRTEPVEIALLFISHHGDA